MKRTKPTNGVHQAITRCIHANRLVRGFSMRGRNDINRSQERRRQRCLLAGLLCAASQSAWAEAPVVIAPLPLVVPFEQNGQSVQVNPFCRPVTTSSDEATVHAAGMIQLVPLEMMPESQVMLSSGQLVETPLTNTTGGGVEFRIEAFSGPTAEAPQRGPVAYPVPVPIVNIEPVPEQIITSERLEPQGDAVAFSFSDNQAPAEPTLVRPRRAAQPVVAAAPEPLLESPAEPGPPVRVVWQGNTDQVTHIDPPSLSGAASDSVLPAPTLARPAGHKPLLVPIEDQPGAVVTAIGSSRLPAPPRPSTEPRLVNGARPKVEVGRPPLVVQRGQSRILTVEPERPTPVSAQEIVTPEPPPQPLPELVAKANLRFQPTEVRALKVDHPVQRVDVQNTAVCAAVKTGPQQVQLIATGVGKTKLTLWTVDAAGQEQGELYEIHVTDTRTAQADDAQSLAATLTQSIETAFPVSRIVVHYQNGRLLISGSCPDEDSARRILRMVRSACAMPVDDKITVR